MVEVNLSAIYQASSPSTVVDDTVFKSVAIALAVVAFLAIVVVIVLAILLARRRRRENADMTTSLLQPTAPLPSYPSSNFNMKFQYSPCFIEIIDKLSLIFF